MTKGERESRLARRAAEMREFEDALRARGVLRIAGVDEVGRGPLAGPVTAAAVVLPPDFSVLGVDDSKKLSEKRREALDEIIRAEALAFGLGFADNRTIDEINILEATKLAMRLAVEEAARVLAAAVADACGAPATIEHILVDALRIPGLDAPQTALIKGDERSVSIAAASIVAKVARDRLMRSYHRSYPAYSFDRNKGYGTRAHLAAIEIEGLSPLHRRSFCRRFAAARPLI
ncbi:MAG: ribonuclease HII [Clostridiales Family XIII bacterium]|jgi:ribonuclease HII|nr:ribonuclease HII [Clostridiales Family XIII bacterium]